MGDTGGLRVCNMGSGIAFHAIDLVKLKMQSTQVSNSLANRIRPVRRDRLSIGQDGQNSRGSWWGVCPLQLIVCHSSPNLIVVECLFNAICSYVLKPERRERACAVDRCSHSHAAPNRQGSRVQKVGCVLRSANASSSPKTLDRPRMPASFRRAATLTPVHPV